MKRRTLTAAAVFGPWWHALPARAEPAPARVVLMRHARTVPGVGDPPGYRLDDCRTQRNLSEEGRADARRIGQQLRALGLQPQVVRSSRWCRCLDTAREAFGRVEPWPALDSFFDAPSREAAQTAELRRALTALAPGRVEAWVTHMVNIAALTGENVAMGEVLLLAASGTGWRLVERLRP